MKHAYLIIAHNNYDQLKKLIEMIDSDISDVYIHINKLMASPNEKEILKVAAKSKVEFVSRVPVVWGGQAS